MKMTLVAALASLMLAGVFSAVSGATPTFADGTTIVLGDGTSPAPLIAPQSFQGGDSTLNQ